MHKMNATSVTADPVPGRDQEDGGLPDGRRGGLRGEGADNVREPEDHSLRRLHHAGMAVVLI